MFLLKVQIETHSKVDCVFKINGRTGKKNPNKVTRDPTYRTNAPIGREMILLVEPNLIK